MASKSRPLRAPRAARASGVSSSRPQQARTETDAQANKLAGMKKQFSLRAMGFRSVKLHAEDLVYKDERASRKLPENVRGKAMHGRAQPSMARHSSEITEQQSYGGEDCVDVTQKAGVGPRTRHSTNKTTARSSREISRSPAPRTAVKTMLKYAGLKSKHASFQVRGFRSVKWATKSVPLIEAKPEHLSEEPTEESEGTDPGNIIPGSHAEESVQGAREQACADPIRIEPWEGASRKRVPSCANENNLTTGRRSLWSMHYDNEPDERSDASESCDEREDDGGDSSSGVDEIWGGGGGGGGGNKGRAYHRKKKSQAYTFFTLINECHEEKEGASDAAGGRPGWLEYAPGRRRAAAGREEGQRQRQEHERNRVESSKYCRKQTESDGAMGRRRGGTVSKERDGSTKLTPAKSRLQTLRTKLKDVHNEARDHRSRSSNG